MADREWTEAQWARRNRPWRRKARRYTSLLTRRGRAGRRLVRLIDEIDQPKETR